MPQSGCARDGEVYRETRWYSDGECDGVLDVDPAQNFDGDQDREWTVYEGLKSREF
jgi:hypothetical protein